MHACDVHQVSGDPRELHEPGHNAKTKNMRVYRSTIAYSIRSERRFRQCSRICTACGPEPHITRLTLRRGPDYTNERSIL